MSHHPCCGDCNSGSGSDTQEAQESKTRVEVSYVLHKLITKVSLQYFRSVQECIRMAARVRACKIRNRLEFLQY